MLDIFFKKEYFESVIDVPFEDGIFMINSGYDGFLRDYYGDYMKVPEKHEQVNHGDIIVDLEKITLNIESRGYLCEQNVRYIVF